MGIFAFSKGLNENANKAYPLSEKIENIDTTIYIEK